MKKGFISILALLVLLAPSLAACQPANPTPTAGGPLKVLAVETFLADVAQNVAGDRAQVESLIPAGLDPHAFEPTPRDVARIASSSVLILNGHGLEDWLANVLQNAGGERLVIEASAGMQPRVQKAGEISASEEHPDQGDPHFWLDPISMVQYTLTIRDGLTKADPAGKDTYTKNADAYIAQLKELDGWIREQVAQVPTARRQIITNHESLGYFADRYGFTISGTIIASVSSSAAPSARQIAALIDSIRKSGAPAIFLETGTNPQMADQIASETHIRVISGLYTHSVSPPGGEAPTYIAMMKANTKMIVDALK